MRIRSAIAILIGSVVASAALSPASAMQIDKILLPSLSVDLVLFKKKKLPKIKFQWPWHGREGQSAEPKHSIKGEEPKITKPELPPSDQIARQKTEGEAALLFENALADLPQSLREASQQRLREEIERHIVAILKSEANKPKPRWTFQPTSGKLTINASLDVAGGRIEAPDINVYVVAGLISAAAAADQGCKSSTSWSDCARKFIVSAIREAMKNDSK